MPRHHRSPPSLLLVEPFSIRQSFAQSRLWFLHQLEPNRAQHNVIFSILLNGSRIQPDQVQHALDVICQRHTVLRTCYRSTTGGEEQWVAPAERIAMSLVDLRTLGSTEQVKRRDQLLQHELVTPFDLLNGPVLRVTLIRLEDTLHELVISVHHIAFDGRSGEIFLEELAHYYQTDDRIPSRPAALQYADYAAWEPDYISAAQVGAEVGFWRDYLAGMPLQLQFADRPRPEHTPSYARHVFSVPAELLAHLKKVMRAQRQPLFVLLTTVFNLWMYYISGQSRFLVGTDVHGRDLPCLQDIFGFFVNQLTLKCEIDEAMTLAQLLQQTRHNIRIAHAHRRIPFDLLVSSLVPRRQTGQTPLFQIKFNYQQDRFSIAAVGDARVIDTRVIQDAAGFDLVLDLMHRLDRIDATLEYNQQLFSHAEIECFARLWLQLLEQIDTMFEHPVHHLCAQLRQWNTLWLRKQQDASARQQRTLIGRTSRRALRFQ